MKTQSEKEKTDLERRGEMQELGRPKRKAVLSEGRVGTQCDF